ncbi:tyrosine-type recombinase/integrase [Methylocella silvestris]|uniref:tyrosine-type recombinase/integrase n=1 Tax=Methylocella silvestris TaxID=199596 RepID=UPI001FE0F801|nr:tyrosine-type recombinase/integrase [Methylocella silvestris]
MIRGALFTGCRYGELIRLRVADFDAPNGTLAVKISKSGKPRHVVLADEGRRFFEERILERPQQALIFLRDDGAPWAQSHQQRPLAKA